MIAFDWIILFAYMAVVLLIGAWSGKSNKSEEDYFQGGRSLPWYAVGVSVGMTMLSAGAFISNPGWIWSEGMVAGFSNIALPLCIVFCTCTILPMLYHAKVTTMGEYLNLRFGGRTRIVSLILWLLNSFVLIGGFVYTPSLVLENITGVSLNIWVPVIMVLAIAYTVSGGIKAVVWTDTLQGVLLVIGAILALIIAFSDINMPFGQVLSTASQTGLTVSYDMNMRLDNYSVLVCLVGGFVMWVSYFGFNQEQIQRYVTARNIRDVKRTGILSTLMMCGIYWLTYILGIILFVFYQSHTSTLDFANSNNVFVDFIVNYMPNGVKGMMVAAVFAAAMSSLDSVLNSATATFVKDVYEPYLAKGKKASMKQSMLFTCVIAVVAVAFVYIYLSGSSSSIMKSIGAMCAPMQGVMTGILFILLFVPSVNDKACAYGSLIGFVLALLVKSVEGAYGVNWLWCYVYATAFGFLVPCVLAATVFRDPEAAKKAYPYTLKGANERMKGVTDETGYEIRPLKFDRYFFWPIVIFVVLLVLLAVVQTY